MHTVKPGRPATGPAPGHERRAEERYRASGPVRLFLEWPAPQEIVAELVDISAHGFRATHAHLGLSSGTELRFRHPNREGRARVMWSRVAGGSAESGFYILES